MLINIKSKFISFFRNNGIFLLCEKANFLYNVSNKGLLIISELSFVYDFSWLIGKEKGVFYPMKKMKVFLPFAVAALIFGMGACDKKADASNGSNKPVSSVPAKPSIKVTAADNKTKIGLNETVQLSADKDGVAWSSSDKNIADVDATGKVTAKGYGSATIFAKLDGHTDGKITIEVQRPAPTAILHWEEADHYSADGEYTNGQRSADDPSEPIYTKAAASDGKCIAYFGEGDKETLTFTSDKAVKAELMVVMGHNSSFSPLSDIMTAKFNNVDIDLSKINFESDSDGSGNYSFIGVSFGMFNLVAGNNALEIGMKGNAPYLDDLNIYAVEAATIQCVPAPQKEQIVVTNEESSLTIEAESTVQLLCATEGVTYKSSNEAVATVNETSGLVTGVAKGSATITVSKQGMKSARVTIKVTEKVAAGEIRVEAETGTCNGAALTEADAENPSDIIIRTASTGETLTAQWKAGAVLLVKFQATQAGAYKLNLNARAAGQYGMTNIDDLAANIEVKFNDAVVTIPAETAISGRTFADYLIGTVNFKAGENKIEIKSLGEEDDIAPNIDFFKFVPNA